MKNAVYLQYTNPAGYPALGASAPLLADGGWRVFFLGVDVRGAQALRFDEHPNIQILKFGTRPTGWRQAWHYLGFCVWAVVRALIARPRWVYASDLFSCLPALVLSFLGVRVLYHEHDSPEYAVSVSWWTKCLLQTRSRLAARAELCVIPNARRIERFLEMYPRPAGVHCVWNCPSKREISEARRPREAGKELSLYYHGNFGPELLPLALLEALAALGGKIRLCAVGYETSGQEGYKKSLRQRAGELGLNGALRIFEAMPRYALWPLLSTADVGLALFPKKAAPPWDAMVGASNKPFDYLAGGLALLVPDQPDWKKFVVDNGCGLACDPQDPVSLARALACFLENPQAVRLMGEKGRRRVLEEWNYERQFAPVMERLQ